MTPLPQEWSYGTVLAWAAVSAWVGTVVDLIFGAGHPWAALETTILFGVPVLYSPGIVASVGMTIVGICILGIDVTAGSGQPAEDSRDGDAT